MLSSMAAAIRPAKAKKRRLPARRPAKCLQRRRSGKRKKQPRPEALDSQDTVD